jgi:predicted glycosyltransferase
MYDYEFTETKIFNLLSDKVMIPAQIPASTLDEIRLSPSKRVPYEGIKEELYMRKFRPDPGFRERFCRESRLVMTEDSVLVALRPPATTANYHNAAADHLFRQLLVFLDVRPSVRTVIMPRTPEQFGEINALIGELKINPDRIFVAERAISALELAAIADLLISGGGTMNREAALLGTPVYSIFAGRQGALDKAMEASGQIRFVRSTEDILKIAVRRKNHAVVPEITDRVENALTEQINCWL